MIRQSFLLSCLLAFIAGAVSLPAAESVKRKEITFPSGDKITITADLYLVKKDKKTPFIVLCHQARWSRGEYREIAPRLNALGFNCMAIDQRSGDAVNKVKNKTYANAKRAKKSIAYTAAEGDMAAAVAYARKHYAGGKLILWGSSYSAALSLRFAGENPKQIDGVLAFSPGEYFKPLGKSATWVRDAAKKITVPTFITSAKHEKAAWAAIFAAIKTPVKTSFLPTKKGRHGASALWKKTPGSDEYWQAVSTFLKQYFSVNAPPPPAPDML